MAGVEEEVEVEVGVEEVVYHLHHLSLTLRILRPMLPLLLLQLQSLLQRPFPLNNSSLHRLVLESFFDPFNFYITGIKEEFYDYCPMRFYERLMQ